MAMASRFSTYERAHCSRRTRDSTRNTRQVTGTPGDPQPLIWWGGVAFPGGGPRESAAMAVEILERQMGIAVADLHGSDIAYDVHVRRVFLRSGLAERDDSEHMLAEARRLYPERPGALDNPAWDIGRRWCRPTQPQCDSCAIGTVCPQLISQGDAVRGA